MSRWSVVALVVAVGLAGAGCGIPDDSSARGLPRKDVPFDLLASEPVATTTTTLPSVPVDVTVFFVEAGHLVPVTRKVESPATTEKALRALILGPTPAEARKGYRTAIARSTTILSAGLGEGGIAVVDVTNSFHVGSQPDTILAAAQMVYTATAFPEVRGVKFTLEGEQANIYQGDGVQTRFPVGRVTYSSLAPLSGS